MAISNKVIKLLRIGHIVSAGMYYVYEECFNFK